MKNLVIASVQMAKEQGVLKIQSGDALIRNFIVLRKVLGSLFCVNKMGYELWHLLGFSVGESIFHG